MKIPMKMIYMMDVELKQINDHLVQIKWAIFALCFFAISLMYKTNKK